MAAYPEEIARRLIRMFSIFGDTVVDPFVGTGISMKVAMALNRNSIGYEIDKRLIPTIKERFAKVGVEEVKDFQNVPKVSKLFTNYYALGAILNRRRPLLN